jgi:hypothetical protein
MLTKEANDEGSQSVSNEGMNEQPLTSKGLTVGEHSATKKCIRPSTGAAQSLNWNVHTANVSETDFPRTNSLASLG